MNIIKLILIKYCDLTIMFWNIFFVPLNIPVPDVLLNYFYIFGPSKEFLDKKTEELDNDIKNLENQINLIEGNKFGMYENEGTFMSGTTITYHGELQNFDVKPKRPERPKYRICK